MPTPALPLDRPDQHERDLYGRLARVTGRADLHVAVPDLIAPAHRQGAQALFDLADHRGLSVRLSITRRDRLRALEAAAICAADGGVGVIAIDHTPAAAAGLEVPTVVIGEQPASGGWVDYDPVGALALVLAHLRNWGHDHIGFLNAGAIDDETLAPRVDEASRRGGVSVAIEHAHAPHHPILDTLLAGEADAPVSALVVSDDDAAATVRERLDAVGLWALPVCGFNASATGTVPTVDQRMTRRIHAAVAMLQGHSETRHIPNVLRIRS